MIFMDRQEGLLIEHAGGTRRPRTGSCRKPRSKPHPFVGTVCTNTLSPLASSPSSGSSYGKAAQQEDGQYPLRSVGGLLEQPNGLRDSNSSLGNGLSQNKGDSLLLQSEIGGQGLKGLKPCSHSSMMVDGERKTEWKIFQRRHKRRDNSLYMVDLNGSTRSDVGDSKDALGKGVNTIDTMYDGSPEYECTKNFEEAWKDKVSSQKGSKDLAYHLSSSHTDRFANIDYSSRDKAAPSVQSRKDRRQAFTSDWGVQERGNVSCVDHVYKGIISTDQEKRGKMAKGSEKHAITEGKLGNHLCSPIGYRSKGFAKRLHELPSIPPDEKSPAVNRPPTNLKLKVGGTNATHLNGSRQSDISRPNNQGRRRLPEGTLRKPSSATDSRKLRHRLILQDDSDEEVSGFSILSREDSILKDTTVQNDQGNIEHEDEINEEIGTSKHADAIENDTQPLPAVRKSSRVPKKRTFDDDDVELEPKRRRRKKIEVESADDQCRADEGESNDAACEFIQSTSEFPPRRKRQFKKKGEPHTPELDGRKEVPLTARQRALKSSKEGGGSELWASVIEFPEGITPLLHKKQKENLTEAEQAIKKEEAARKRRQQLEKNVKEIQAVAIQKILGQDSTRKKREEKLQKQRQEIEQEKQAAAMMPAINSIRWVMGPSGNVVSFSRDLELPSIFSGPCSYPKERERCAAPACNNAYKYRDSKTLLPLCSLVCYKAVKNLPYMASAF